MKGKAKQNSVRIGLVGCGRISSAHIDSIEKVDGTELAYVCDVDEDKLSTLAEQVQVDSVSDYRHIPLEKVDVISICTPNHLHYEMAKFFLENGKHILVEKPVTIHSSDARDLVSSAKRNGLHFFAVKQVRFNPAVRALKSVVAGGRLGKLLSCNLTIHWNRPQEYFDDNGWRGKKKLDGGTLINAGIHYIDLLVWILGPVKSVFAVTDTLNHNIEVEDHVSAILKFHNGTIGTVEFNVNTYPRNIECAVFIQGSRGSIKVGGLAVNELEVWEVEGVPRPNLRDSFAPNVYADGLYQGSCPNHPFIYENVRDVILGNSRKIATDGEAALKTLELVHKIYQSGNSGVEVEV
jgi:UDP-N-acetyl-2-amino-2-deoxyglucuronate dehydrogenase